MRRRSSGRGEVMLNIIVATYNEGDNLEPLMRRIEASLRGSNMSYKIIIVDDNSPDETAEHVIELSKRYPIRVIKELTNGMQGVST